MEFELGARFEGACGFALILALSQMMEHGLGPFGRADLHPRRNPLDRQGRFAPQPGSDDAVGSLLGGLPVEFPMLSFPAHDAHNSSSNLRFHPFSVLKSRRFRKVVGFVIPIYLAATG